MTADEQDRLIAFLRKKQCTPCRNGQLDGTHGGCIEAEDLIEVVAGEPTEG
jgi:hypothetical protein